MKRLISSETLIPVRFDAFFSAAIWGSERNIEVRFMSRIYITHTLLSMEICKSGKNSLPLCETRKRNLENRFALITAGCNRTHPLARQAEDSPGLTLGVPSQGAGGFARVSMHARNFGEFGFSSDSAPQHILNARQNFARVAASFIVNLSGMVLL
jgi:hypothetical protein